MLYACNTSGIPPSRCAGLVVGVDCGHLSVVLLFSVLCTRYNIDSLSQLEVIATKVALLS